MKAKLLWGKEVAAGIKETICREVSALKVQTGKQPVLATIIVGETDASEVYWNAQKRNAEEMGIAYKLYKISDNLAQENLLAEIHTLNHDETVNGIMLNLPLPEHLNAEEAVASISPLKDAEGIHPENIGDIVIGNNAVAPSTASACLELVKSTGIGLRGKEVVCIGASRIVGKPVSLMLLNEMATVTICHIATSERKLLESHVRRAEVLISAIGKSDIIPSDWIQKEAVVIDVGIHRKNGKLCGDIDTDSAMERAGFISPVPGGVGPLTVAMLMRNLLAIFKIQQGIRPLSSDRST